MELNEEQKEIIAALKAEQNELNRKTNVLENKIAESEKKVKRLTKERNIWAGILASSLVIYGGGTIATLAIMKNNLQDVKTLATAGIIGVSITAVSTAVSAYKTIIHNDNKKQEKAKLKELKYTKYLRDLL